MQDTFGFPVIHARMVQRNFLKSQFFPQYLVKNLEECCTLLHANLSYLKNRKSIKL